MQTSNGDTVWNVSNIGVVLYPTIGALLQQHSVAAGHACPAPDFVSEPCISTSANTVASRSQPPHSPDGAGPGKARQTMVHFRPRHTASPNVSPCEKQSGTWNSLLAIAIALDLSRDGQNKAPHPVPVKILSAIAPYDDLMVEGFCPHILCAQTTPSTGYLPITYQ